LEKAISAETFGGELRSGKMKSTHKILAGLMKKAAIKEGKALVKQMPENIEKLAKGFEN